MADPAVRLGKALHGLYTVEREIGRGGMAIVYQATDHRHSRSVAIKVLRPDLAATLGAERFLREIHLAASLTHPNILPIHDSGEADGILYYVMPFVEGESLRDRLTQQVQLPVGPSLHVARQVAAALRYAHSHGVVHRDIKPENILLVGDEAIVADFGVARAIGEARDTRLTEVGVAIGTPYYMSPEQGAGDRDVDGRSDIYSLGCVLYEMLVGEPPFTGPTAQVIFSRHSLEQIPGLRAARAAVPVPVERAVVTALAKTPADRFQTADEFIEALDAAGAGHPTAEVIVPRARRRRAMVGAATMIVVLAALIAWLGPWRGRGDRAPDPSLVAVMPFRVHGADRARWQDLSEGIIELLYVRLPGDAGPRAVYPATVLSATRGEPQTGAGDLPLEGAAHVAERLGAGLMVLGQIWASGDKLLVSASLHRVPGGRQLARTEDVEGPPDSLIALVDRLAAELLSREAGEADHRLAELVTADLGALRPYLAGKAAFARGRFSEASRQFRIALEVDTAFALAAMDLASANRFIRGAETDTALALAWQARNRLSRRDQTYLQALAGPRYDGPRFHDGRLLTASSSGIERIEAWELAVQALPDRVESWHHLGEQLLHAGPWTGQADVEERAAAAFGRAVALDSTFAPALAHLLDIAARRGDTAAIHRYGPQYLAADSAGDLADFYRWRLAAALGDRAGLEASRARIDELSPAVLERLIAVAQLDALGMEDAARAAEALRARSGTSRDARWADLKRYEIALNAGRPGEAAAIIHTSRGAAPVDAFDAMTDIVQALFWDADSSLAARSVAQRGSAADPPFPPSLPPDDPAYLDLCAVTLWRLARADTSTTRWAIDHLGRVRDPYQEFRSGFIPVCAAMLEARWAAQRDGVDAGPALERLDSLMRTGPPSTSWFLVAANLTVADLREQNGQYAQALAAARRRLVQYDLGEPRVLFGLSSYLRREGRLAALVGDTTAAIRAYQHYLMLRGDPEPSLRGEVDSVRASLGAMLRAEPSGGAVGSSSR